MAIWRGKLFSPPDKEVAESAIDSSSYLNRTAEPGSQLETGRSKTLRKTYGKDRMSVSIPYAPSAY